jgi:hypothetical protein
MRENTKLNYCRKVQEVCDLFPEAIIVNETSGMFPLSIFSKRRISRSHNFEPIHSFRENSGLKKYLYFIPKITGVILERLFSNLLVISSQDLRYYKYFWSPKKICVVPLRNLVMANKNINFNVPNGEINGIAYLSSTFNVKHNSDGVKFLVNKVFNKPEMDSFELNIYGDNFLLLSYIFFLSFCSIILYSHTKSKNTRKYCISYFKGTKVLACEERYLEFVAININ